MTRLFATDISQRGRSYPDVAVAVADIEARVDSPVVAWSGPDDGSDAFQIQLENDLEISGDVLDDRITIHFAIVADGTRNTSRSLLTVEDKRLSKDRVPDDLPGFSTPADAIASSLAIARESAVSAAAGMTAKATADAKKENLAAAIRIGKAVAAAHVSPQSSGVVIEATMPSRWSAALVRIVGQDGPVFLPDEEERIVSALLGRSVRVDCFGRPPVMQIEADVLDFDVRDLPSPIEAARMLREVTAGGSCGAPARERKEQ